MDNFVDLIQNYKYLVIGNDNTCNVYKSLRDISNDINVDYSTISKNLNDTGICTSKETKNHYYIKKIKIDLD
jgi:hypothetical protein